MVSGLLSLYDCFLCGESGHIGVLIPMETFNIPLCLSCWKCIDEIPNVFLTAIAFLREES